jgi:Cd2+/Zn2+-exporting ATPase
VASLEPLNGTTPNELLALAASAEHGSEHAIGRAVVREARERELAVTPAQEFNATPGLGVEARVGGERVTVGQPEWLRKRGHDLGACQDRIAALQAEGKTVVLVARDARIAGIIAITDRLRSGGAVAVRALRELGIERIVMLTGDHPASARAVASEVGILEYHAGLMPAGKVARVEALRVETGSVAMVGDGINDAPALAAATVGIAMGATGTDVALETADVALIGDDLTRLPFVVGLSRRTVGIIGQNIRFSVAVKATFLALTVMGVTSLWLAVLADTGTSIVVVLNSLRLLRTTDGGRGLRN